MEAQALDDQARLVGGEDQVHASPGEAPNLEESSTIAPVLGTLMRRASPASGACFLIFLISS